METGAAMDAMLEMFLPKSSRGPKLRRIDGGGRWHIKPVAVASTLNQLENRGAIESRGRDRSAGYGMSSPQRGLGVLLWLALRCRRCTGWAKVDGGCCPIHDPSRADERRQWRAKGGLRTRGKLKLASPEDFPRLAPETAEEAKRWSAWLVRAVTEDLLRHTDGG